MKITDYVQIVFSLSKKKYFFSSSDIGIIMIRSYDNLFYFDI